MKTALLFPGQGSQKVGMGVALAERFEVARRTFQEADEALGFSLSKLCAEGPADQLELTANAQPAILTTSIAAWRIAESEKGLSFDVAAGHSLGEWSALVAAGALRFSDAVRLVRLRGEAMQRAVPVGAGGMAAILGLDLAAATELCQEAAEGQVCAPANLNGGGQIVISGDKAAVERACAAAKGKGAKKAVPLAVSAPFHSALMKPAADEVAAALAEVEIGAMRAPVVANVTAEENADPARVRELLVAQVTGAVRWEESMQRLAALGVTRAFELGAGAVLRGLARRITPDITIKSVGEPADVDSLEV